MKMNFVFAIIVTALFFIAACEDQGDPVTAVVTSPIPSVTGVIPDSGAVGDTVRITGANFGAARGTSIVNFGIVSAVTFINWTAGEIRVKVPVGASTDSVSVTVGGRTSNKKRFRVITVSNAPVLVSVSPDSGKIGDTITVAGSNFGAAQGSSTVSFGGTSATTIVSWSAVQIKVVIPAGLVPGTTTIALTVNGQSSNAKSFKVVSTVQPISFAGDIAPIFNSRGCAGCHGGSGGLTVLPHSSLLSGTSNHGPVITAGDGEGSVLVKKLRGTAGFGSRMPQGGSALPESEIKKIADWINQGALNN